MPKLISLYMRQTAIGFALSAVFVGMLLYFNVVNLWHLVTHTDGGFLAVGLLWVFNGIVFAGVQFGITIMRMADTEDDRDDGGNRSREYATIPVRVEERKQPF